MSSTGTKRIIENYIANGGAAMDESAYHVFKAAILTKWLDGGGMFERFTLTPPGIKEDPSVLSHCIEPHCEGLFTVDQAIQHLKVHRPEWFQD